MNTLEFFQSGVSSIPTRIAWTLSDLGEALGKQGLFKKQAPQRLQELREHAMVESAVSSNRIEGVEVDRKRVGTLIFGQAAVSNRDEEELRGYRDALDLIHSDATRIRISQATIKKLHALSRGQLWHAGKYKVKDGDIIERYPDGRSRVRFRTVRAADTNSAIKSLLNLWRSGLKEEWMHPLILLAAFNLDFLCIHPFRDGNGRVSRLLLLLQSYQLGYEVGRYISLERIIEQNKERYYETLEESSHGWHQRKHDPWPFVGFVLFVFKNAYRQFEERLGEPPPQKGMKTQSVVDAIESHAGSFRVSDIAHACPGVSLDMVRTVLKRLKAEGKLKCLGRGRNARWENT
jgi:Fic family protein